MKVRFLVNFPWGGHVFKRLQVYDIPESVARDLSVITMGRRTPIFEEVETTAVEAPENASKKVRHVKRTGNRNRANRKSNTAK